MDPALREAVLGAGNIQAPASPLGASNAPELAKLYQSSFRLPQSVGAAQAGANIAEEQVAAAKRAAAEAKARQDDLADISKYRIVKKEDGGFDFFSPDGSQVDIATLSQRTQLKAADILEKFGSENPVDVQYIQDYKNLQDYGQALLNGDTEKMKKFHEQKKELGDLYNKNKKQSAQDYMKTLADYFKKHYERFYVPRDKDPNAWGRKPSDPLFRGGGTSSGSDEQAIVEQLRSLAAE